MKGRRLKVSLRHTEVCILLAVALFVIFVSQGSLATFKAFEY